MKTPVLERFYQRFNTWLTPPPNRFSGDSGLCSLIDSHFLGFPL